MHIVATSDNTLGMFFVVRCEVYRLMLGFGLFFLTIVGLSLVGCRAEPQPIGTGVDARIVKGVVSDQDGVDKESDDSNKPQKIEYDQPDTGTPAETIAKKRIGVYVFDGTDTNWNDSSIIRLFLESADADVGFYQEGPDLFGAAMRFNIDKGKQKICDDWLEGRVDQIFLAGYSRGAVTAVTIAYELLTDPSETKEWDSAKYFCKNSSASALESKVWEKEQLRPNIVWIGLLDNCNSLNYDMPAKIPQPGPSCFHRVKQNEWEHMLTTKHVQGCEVSRETSLNDNGMPMNHNQLAHSAPSLEALLHSARASGM